MYAKRFSVRGLSQEKELYLNCSSTYRREGGFLVE